MSDNAVAEWRTQFFPAFLATGVTWNEQHKLTGLKRMFVSLWHCDVSNDAMCRNVVPRNSYNLQVQLITAFESWGHPLMMWRKVKGLKDAWRGTPLPRSSINQNCFNQIQVTKSSIQCIVTGQIWYSESLQGLEFLEIFVRVCLLPLHHAPCVHQGQEIGWCDNHPKRESKNGLVCAHVLIWKSEFNLFHIDQFCPILIIKTEICQKWMQWVRW